MENSQKEMDMQTTRYEICEMKGGENHGMKLGRSFLGEDANKKKLFLETPYRVELLLKGGE
jgi:hypothetical protein